MYASHVILLFTVLLLFCCRNSTCMPTEVVYRCVLKITKVHSSKYKKNNVSETSKFIYHARCLTFSFCYMEPSQTVIVVFRFSQIRPLASSILRIL